LEFFGKNVTDGRGTVGADSDPVHEVSVVLDVLNTDGVAMEFTVGGTREIFVDWKGTEVSPMLKETDRRQHHIWRAG